MTTSGPEGKARAEAHTEPAAAPHGTVPENEQQLRHEIEQTRERLGDTVEQLAAKTDLKDRAHAKAAAMTGRVWQAVPGPVRRTAMTGVSVARQRRVPLIAAALIAGCLVLRWRAKR